MAQKFINVRLDDTNERDAKLMQFLEGRSTKHTVLEALEMYEKHYTAMKEKAMNVQQPVISTTAATEPQQEEPQQEVPNRVNLLRGKFNAE